ncbi:methyltransferase domain-containing protein [Candidatus Woesearchaeota archaeon]|nr:MAG: methyltransferase domain-containing protein [Candidatus Woesearchaeota archaeon]
MFSKSKLAILLSRLKDFERPNVKLEQYSTPSEIAAEVVYRAAELGDIKGKSILDPACGPGFLGIAALLLGAKKVNFLDASKEAIALCRENVRSISKEYNIGKAEFTLSRIQDFSGKYDVVVQNPPFGTKIRHHDRDFLIKAFETASVVYSFHKVESRDFLYRISADNNFRITHAWLFDFALPASQKFHKRRIHRIRVGCWRFKK